MGCFRGGFAQRGGGAQNQVTNGSCSGTVIDGSSNPVSGVTITLTSSGGSSSTTTTDGSGNYSFTNKTPANYTIRQDPTRGYSIGPSEADDYTISINNGVNTSKNFIVQAAHWVDQWQSASDTANLTGSIQTSSSPHFTNPPFASGQIMAGFPNGTLTYWTGNNESVISLGTWPLDTSKAVKVDVPDRSGLLPSYFPAWQSYNGTAAEWNNKSELWLRWLDYWTTGFTPGGGGNTGSGAEYKSLFLDVAAGVSIQIEWENRNGGAPDDFIGVRMKMITSISTWSGGTGAVTDGIYPPGPNQAYIQQKDYQPAKGSLLGVANTWVLGVTGIGTTDTHAKLYINGTLIIHLNCNWLGSGVYPSLFNIQYGANFNGGPNAACQRYWRQASTYYSRPSMITGIIA